MFCFAAFFILLTALLLMWPRCRWWCLCNWPKSDHIFVMKAFNSIICEPDVLEGNVRQHRRSSTNSSSQMCPVVLDAKSVVSSSWRVKSFADFILAMSCSSGQYPRIRPDTLLSPRWIIFSFLYDFSSRIVITMSGEAGNINLSAIVWGAFLQHNMKLYKVPSAICDCRLCFCWVPELMTEFPEPSFWKKQTKVMVSPPDWHDVYSWKKRVLTHCTLFCFVQIFKSTTAFLPLAHIPS